MDKDSEGLRVRSQVPVQVVQLLTSVIKNLDANLAFRLPGIITRVDLVCRCVFACLDRANAARLCRMLLTATVSHEFNTYMNLQSDQLRYRLVQTLSTLSASYTGRDQ